MLLSTVTALAVHDLLGTMSSRPTKATKKILFPNKAEWGKHYAQVEFHHQFLYVAAFLWQIGAFFYKI